MIIGMRYTKGFGNNKVYYRIRNIDNLYYNFISSEWSTDDSLPDCRAYLSELSDSDPTESLYLKNITVSLNNDTYIKEVIDSTNMSVIGIDIGGPEIDFNSMALDISNLKTNIDLITDMQTGNWEILNNQMIFLDRNNIEIMRFNLLDKLGLPSDHNIFKRVKV